MKYLDFIIPFFLVVFFISQYFNNKNNRERKQFFLIIGVLILFVNIIRLIVKN